ncbi:transcription elongation factor GreA [Levilactobacillus spicheri]|uniref:Transcription elongation factor GreA n=1 Tax=Levilactobacillus spicheri TaxID=216463 RepID=A0A0F3RVU2_9LACO|nr:transcription elongation factor GreA [Levilactobacillus spicheri]KJW13724.1 transcription elongation factor GreA [Levilactobacillus spicheri]
MPKNQFNPITAAGYRQIQAEIAALEADRPHKIASLAEARAHGDLSENAEYSAAKRDLRHLESRLRFLNKQLQYAKVVQPSTNDTVELGKWVTLEFLDDHDTATYQLVGAAEADLDAGKTTRVSPLGKAITGHHPGDTVTVHAPAASYAVKITAVSLTAPQD